MIPEEVKPPDPEPSAKSEEIQPKDSPQEDPIRPEAKYSSECFPMKPLGL
jgi:hypothetical protein